MALSCTRRMRANLPHVGEHSRDAEIVSSSAAATDDASTGLRCLDKVAYYS